MAVPACPVPFPAHCPCSSSPMAKTVPALRNTPDFNAKKARPKLEPRKNRASKTYMDTEAISKKHCKQFPTLAGWNQYCASKHTLSWLSPCLLFSHSAVVRTRCIQDKSCCFTCAWQMSKLIWAVRFLQLDHPTIRRYRGLSQDEAMPPARCDLPNLRGSGANGLVLIWRRGKGLNTTCISYM
jgi:hypothetical protein